jgi:hypothetical protein
MFHDRSPWLSKAMFRDAMAGYFALAGPNYDLNSLERVRRELASFLASEPENVEFARQAQAALAHTGEWLARKHVLIADFYATVDNTAGHRYHLEVAAREFGATPAGSEAKARLELIPAAPAGGEER